MRLLTSFALARYLPALTLLQFTYLWSCRRSLWKTACFSCFNL